MISKTFKKEAGGEVHTVDCGPEKQAYRKQTYG
jgi:hypothetical protein